MKRQGQADPAKQTGSYSKAFHEGIKTLQEELQLAFQWQRPSILLAVHNSILGQTEAQKVLQQELEKMEMKVEHIKMDAQHPDVIVRMNEVVDREPIVFFVSGSEKTDKIKIETLCRALNFSRELLVENSIRVVFWFTRAEADVLPRLAPDFWAFRHRVIEFAPTRGKRNHPVPTGLFFWKEHIPWMEINSLIDSLAHLQKTLSHLPNVQDSLMPRLDIHLRLIHLCWLVNDTHAFSTYLNEANLLSSKYSFPEYGPWLLNAEAINEYEAGHTNNAFDLFTQALESEPGNSLLMMNLGIANHALGRNSNALTIGKRAIKKEPANLMLSYILGCLYLSMGKAENAIDLIKRVLEKDPSNIDAHYLLALCYLKNRQAEQAVNEIEITKKVSPRQNLFQELYENIVKGKVNEARSQIHQSLQQGKISAMQLLRDPALCSFMDLSEFSASRP